MSFQIHALDPKPFSHLFGLGEVALAAMAITRVKVTETPGVPCRVTLSDLAIGDTALLVNHQHMAGHSPYRAQGPIFIREGQDQAVALEPDTIPEVLRRRLLSLRAYDTHGMMVDADVVDGQQADELLNRLLAIPEVTNVDIHFARRGCFAARALPR